MKNILCLCSAFKSSLIAGVLKGKEFFAEYNSDASCSETMLLNVDAMLEKSGTKIAEIDEISVVVGPGSFTGIRIAIAIAKGFALALPKIKFISISSLKLLALSAQKQLKVQGNILAVMDGLSGRYFVCEYNPVSSTFDDERCVTEMELGLLMKNCPNTVCNQDEIAVSGAVQIKISSKDLLEETLIYSENKVFVSQRELLPNYLRLSQAEEDLNQKKSLIKEHVEICEMNVDELDSVYAISLGAFKTESASKKMMLDEFNSDCKKHFLAKANGEVVGFLTIMIAGGELEILNIATKLGYERIGIGSKLLEHLFNYCKTNLISRIFLEVNETNYSAIKFYEKYDFKVISTRKKYYSGVNDAYVMKKEL